MEHMAQWQKQQGALSCRIEWRKRVSKSSQHVKTRFTRLCFGNQYLFVRDESIESRFRNMLENQTVCQGICRT